MVESDENHILYRHFWDFFGFSDGPIHANTHTWPLIILHLPPTPSIEVRQCGPICTASGPLFPPMYLHNTPHNLSHLRCVDSGGKKSPDCICVSKQILNLYHLLL